MLGSGGSYLCSVGAGQAELHDEHRLGGDDGVRGGVGRGSDGRVGAALSCQHSTQLTLDKGIKDAV